MSDIMKMTEYNRYGYVDCSYCDGKDIKRDNIGKHLMKFHKDKLKDNFTAYLNNPNWNQPFVNTNNKLYTFCFVCNLCHLTASNKPSKPAIKHMTGNCSYENQYNQLKLFLEDKKPEELSSPDIISIPIIVTPTYKTHISNNSDNSIYEKQYSNIMAEIAKLKQEIIELRTPTMLIREIPEVCTDCKEWGEAFSNKAQELDELKVKLNID
jgi:hypothetical protein